MGTTRVPGGGKARGGRATRFGDTWTAPRRTFNGYWPLAGKSRDPPVTKAWRWFVSPPNALRGFYDMNGKVGEFRPWLGVATAGEHWYDSGTETAPCSEVCSFIPDKTKRPNWGVAFGSSTHRGTRSAPGTPSKADTARAPTLLLLKEEMRRKCCGPAIACVWPSRSSISRRITIWRRDSLRDLKHWRGWWCRPTRHLRLRLARRALCAFRSALGGPHPLLPTNWSSTR